MVEQEFLLVSRCIMEKHDAQWRGEGRPEGRDNISLSLNFSCLDIKLEFHFTSPSEFLIQLVWGWIQSLSLTRVQEVLMLRLLV